MEKCLYCKIEVGGIHADGCPNKKDVLKKPNIIAGYMCRANQGEKMARYLRVMISKLGPEFKIEVMEANSINDEVAAIIGTLTMFIEEWDARNKYCDIFSEDSPELKAAKELLKRLEGDRDE